jgi:hypothetical protein
MPAKNRAGARAPASQVGCTHSWLITRVTSGPRGPKFSLRCLLCDLALSNASQETANLLTGHRV